MVCGGEAVRTGLVLLAPHSLRNLHDSGKMLEVLGSVLLLCCYWNVEWIFFSPIIITLSVYPSQGFGAASGVTV